MLFLVTSTEGEMDLFNAFLKYWLCVPGIRLGIEI